MEKMGSGAWHSVSRLGDMLGCREWGWLGGRRPRHVCRSEYQSVSAGTSAHTLQAHSWEPLRIRDDSKGQHFRHLQVLLWEEPSAAPPPGASSPARRSADPCHQRTTSQVPEAVALPFPLSAQCHPESICGGNSYTAPFSTWPQAAPLWTLVPWNIPGCLPGGHRCHPPSLLFGAQTCRDHGCVSWWLRGHLKSEGIQMAMQSLATSAVTCPSTS